MGVSPDWMSSLEETNVVPQIQTVSMAIAWKMAFDFMRVRMAFVIKATGTRRYIPCVLVAFFCMGGGVYFKRASVSLMRRMASTMFSSEVA